MTKQFLLVALFLLFINSQTSAQITDSLRQRIERIISNKNAAIGVSIKGKDYKDTFNFNQGKHFPMLSVFKFPIALVALSEIDKGKFLLTQKIKISKEELLNDTWSPIRDEFPNGTTMTLAEIIDYTVSQSDNNGCDILLNLIGGTKTVEEYFQKINLTDISIKGNEEDMHKEWNVQYQNWITPGTSNELLELFYRNKKKLLSKKSYRFIWKIMKETETGKKRIKGQLPQNTIVAHKTGTSDTNKEGLTAAVNDIGIVFLPNGQYYFISVFVSNSKEISEINERIIADISKVTWDYFITKNK
jgi:beta-lactamase class A